MEFARVSLKWVEFVRTSLVIEVGGCGHWRVKRQH